MTPEPGKNGAKRPGGGRWDAELSGVKAPCSTRLDAVAVLRLHQLQWRYGLSEAAMLEHLILEAHDRYYYSGDDGSRLYPRRCLCGYERGGILDEIDHRR